MAIHFSDILIDQVGFIVRVHQTNRLKAVDDTEGWVKVQEESIIRFQETLKTQLLDKVELEEIEESCQTDKELELVRLEEERLRDQLKEIEELLKLVLEIFKSLLIDIEELLTEHQVLVKDHQTDKEVELLRDHLFILRSETTDIDGEVIYQ